MGDQRCKTADFSFDVPSGWTDRTIVVWSAAPEAAPVPPNFVIAYDRPKPGEPLGEYVNRQLADLGRTAQKFQLQLRRDITFAGRPAVEFIFCWDAAAGTMQQRQVYGGLPDGRVVSIASTARASDFADADKEFRQILRSFRWEA